MQQVWFSKVGLYMRTVEKYGRFGTYPVSADKGSETDETGPHATAKKWAGEGYRYVEVENKGFSDVVLTDLDFRGNGGRAYKVMVTIDGLEHEVDLREDVMMEVLMTRGVEVGGKLNGTYCFVRRGSEIRLELEGSKGHAEALKEYARVSRGRKLKKSELVVGNVYKGTAGDPALYFGEVYVGSKMTDAGKPKKTMMFTSYFNPRHYDYADVSHLVSGSYAFKNSVSYTEDVTELGDEKSYEVRNLLDAMISEWDAMFNSGIAYYEYKTRVMEEQIVSLQEGSSSAKDVKNASVEMIPEGVLYEENLANYPRVQISEDNGTIARDVEELARRSALYDVYELARSNHEYKKKEFERVLYTKRYNIRW